ncbi:MAG: hypothetical protein B7Y53_04415 [Halothiobacillus sp. 28-55-5]|jgi:hypothetical protein|nr:MAG: hypothetical protein B7Y53_04415 [Halothiobacillus sp. 28-55-5]
MLFVGAPNNRVVADMTLTKLEAALHQLDVAMSLFLKGDYLSSLTLAGAAEEILGQLCLREGKPNAVEFIIEYHLPDTDPALPDKQRRKILRDAMNGPRNEAKHANDPEEVDVIVDQYYPLQMIMRALPMARSLGGVMSHQEEMTSWINENITGTER